MSDRHFEQVFADLPSESDIVGHPIDSSGLHPAWRVVGYSVIAVCGAAAFGIVVYVVVALGPL